MTTFVLVHGGWDGGWAWRGVANILRTAGHEVYTPTLTGSGERMHLATPEVNLDTHIQDVAHVLQYEDLYNVVLVGSSYAGMVITGVADRVPERLAHVIYLDAFVPNDGESAMDLLDPAVATLFYQAAAAYGDGWRVPHNPPDADRRTPFLLKAGTQALTLKNPPASNIKRTYVLFTNKSSEDFTKPLMERMAARARAAGWNYREMPFEHWPFLNRPSEVAALLVELA
jgi:pimeloyl-ACP methyl ester carboxylesterase